jgi:hypothetical protein
MKIDCPTWMCSGWLTDSVELLSGVVESGNGVTCNPVCGGAGAAMGAATGAAGITGAGTTVCPGRRPHNITAAGRRYVLFPTVFIDIVIQPQ